MKKVIAVLESMWDWRGMTSGAGYREAPAFFSINPENFSGKRLYRIVGANATLLVTNACRELVESANHHGTPDPAWLAQNLQSEEPFDLLLVCGKVAKATYEKSGVHYWEKVIEMPHPAARNWTNAALDAMHARIQKSLHG